jgi:hypothetical protein
VNGEPDIGRRIARLQGRRALLTDSRDSLVRDIGVARARQSYREEVDAVLDALEARFHARSLGILEKLLGAFLEDVLPREDDKQPQSVSLQMETQRGLPALQIAVRNGEHMEDALRGRGGSVANILSTGLRFAALSRAGKDPVSGFTFRPFLILDEADCWIRRDRIMAFSEVISQLAKDSGIQILMISHHPAELLKGFPVWLERNETASDAMESASLRVRHVPMAHRTAHISEDMADEDARGFKGIRLLNFMSHSDSDIPLHQEVTLLTGDNDIGKSAVTEAFRAICYNEASDTVIRHGKDQAEVILTLENGQTLHWIRVRKGAPKTRYILKDAQGAIVRETPSPKGVPDWARNLLGVDLLGNDSKDALDVQIGDQKSPVFLLDRSPSQRAAILDMGRESQHLRHLRDQWKKQVDADRRTIREGEKKLAELQASLKILEDLDDMEEESILYGKVCERTQAHLNRLREAMSNLPGTSRIQEALRITMHLPNRVNIPNPALWSSMAAMERDMQIAVLSMKRLDFWRSWSSPQTLEPLPEAGTQLLVRRAEYFVNARGMHKTYTLWQDRTVPQSIALPVLGQRSAHAGSVRSAARLLSAARIASRVGHVAQSIPDISSMVHKTDRMYQGYRMGSEAQHLQRAIRDADVSLQGEMKARSHLQKERADLLAKWGICPFCEQGHSSESHTHKKGATA